MAGGEVFTLMDRWRQLSTRVQLALMLALVGAIMGVLYLGTAGEPEDSGITTEQYNRWRSECADYATETLDTRVFRVGGNEWIDKVNACLLAKAKD